MDIENKTASSRPLTSRPRKSGERGATILEFAIAFVLTFVLIFAMIDFARALYSFHYLSNAAR
jgi:Flp pilus assembly protein TadG